MVTGQRHRRDYALAFVAGAKVLVNDLGGTQGEGLTVSLHGSCKEIEDAGGKEC